jgi:hypothetical protein
MSFHWSSAACDNPTAAFGGSFFFAASCASVGMQASPAPNTSAAMTIALLIFSPLTFL